MLCVRGRRSTEQNLECGLRINFSKQPGGNSGLSIFIKMMYNSGNHSSSILKNKERNQ
jgi:hypothetical protein